MQKNKDIQFLIGANTNPKLPAAEGVWERELKP